MQVGILDLGTNTFNVFIAETFPDKTFKKIYKSKISVKLGEGGINNNFIEEKAFERGIRALKKHKKTINEYDVEKTIAFATSAIRSATNGKHFIEVAKEKTGIDIEIISGDKEAELIYYGVRSSVTMCNHPSLIIDIGGGSTEFIISNKNKIIWKQSFLLGVARLLEKFKPSDPIKELEIKKIETYLEEQLQPLFSAVATLHATADSQNTIIELIGSSGSFDSFAEMIAHRFYNINVVKNKKEYNFNLNDCEKIYELILKSTLKERLQMPGLIKMRADMIVISVVFVNYIFRRLKLKEMRLSKYSLKEGILWKLLHA